MNLERIELDGFGKLNNFKVELKSRLNVFYGSNEAGKSTLQQAILALLFGFYQGEPARPEENRLRLKFQPWQETKYAGA